MAACVSQRQLPAAAGRDRQQGRRRHPAASCACSAACDSAHLLLTLRRHLALLLLRLRHLRLKLPAHGQERHPSVLVRGLAARRQLVALCAQTPGQLATNSTRALAHTHTNTLAHTHTHTQHAHTHTHTLHHPVLTCAIHSDALSAAARSAALIRLILADVPLISKRNGCLSSCRMFFSWGTNSIEHERQNACKSVGSR